MPGNLIWKGEGTETCERRALLPIPGLREFIIIIMIIIISTTTIIIIILIGWFWSNMNCVKNLIVSHVKEATVPNLFWCQSLTWKKWSPTKFSSHRREMCWLLHLKISTSGGANYSSALLQKPDKKDLLVKNKLFSHKALCDSSENIWDPSRIYWAQVTPRLDSRVWRTGTGNSRYREFSFFLVVSEPVSEKFGTGKKYRYRYRKNLVPEKSIGTGIGKIWYRKKYRNWYRKKINIKKALFFFLILLSWYSFIEFSF